MGLQGHRRTSSHKRRRAAHFELTAKRFVQCKNCHALMLPHVVCKNCGMYKGTLVIAPKTPKKKTRTPAS